jgi:hypothetical protein
MPEITLEKIYNQLEKIAEYVISQGITKADLAQLATKADFALFSAELKELRTDFDIFGQETNSNFSQLLERLHSNAKRLDNIELEIKAIFKKLDILDDHITNLEIHNLRYRVRDKEN